MTIFIILASVIPTIKQTKTLLTTQTVFPSLQPTTTVSANKSNAALVAGLTVTSIIMLISLLGYAIIAMILCKKSFKLKAR